MLLNIRRVVSHVRAVTIYSDPTLFGLELVAEVDVCEPCYSFDLACVWRESATGFLYGAYDSGCSCPSPFEDYTSLDALERIRSVDDADQLIKQGLSEWNRDCYGDRLAFLAKVREALVSA